MKFNMIMPTIGRRDEIFEFIHSIKKGGYEITVLISDQNPIGYLDPESFGKCIASDNINIKYQHSFRKGLSYNRNILLKNVSDAESIVCFPDDDCAYYSDTLDKVSNFFASNPDVDVVVGCIFDRENNKKILKNWPGQRKNINRFNFYFLASSITIFTKYPSSIRFDESMGAGTYYGSCEDPDYLYELLKSGSRIVYEPSIQVWHPEPDFTTMSLDKVSSYARGFGYFIKKETDIYKLTLLIMLLIKKTAQAILLRGKFQRHYFKSYFVGLFSGLFGK